MASSTTTPAEVSSKETDRRGIPGAGAGMVADQPVRLVWHRSGLIGQTARTVHLVPIQPDCRPGVVTALCGTLLCHDEIEPVEPAQGVPCQVCLMKKVGTATPTEVSSDDAAGFPRGAPYQAWDWPVTQHRDLVQLRLDGDASAIAIPVPLSAAVTQVLTDRHCAPAVLAHPCAPEHHMVLAGERFGAALPWPSGVYQVTGTVMLPPTITICGPITWMQPPNKDSLRLSREIDVFGALRTVLGT